MIIGRSGSYIKRNVASSNAIGSVFLLTAPFFRDYSVSTKYLASRPDTAAEAVTTGTPPI